ncbi:NAD-dependent epimerase/dehydratase family protein [Algibacter amylolyticus]|uniref:NAD-dependent epimerase/dehydratase family protein n=1 Tax=Algibacter amylolyticus TaxID=1608400 RepID=A0A5M7BBN1_9FLAO|nr:NAD-dependent epimerase/dehydratase family protein [Algibacter amylolyticus]KAA5825708.1 NAD-dependent epimerase/dehydratase family protein [Algibacter amylolyticus]MBB5268059.1 dihydroflavonol-4-reductase [Algibacter amylolyticus]TSJ80006.1 NAD-dependent epimerase/dehydratase family protein [Algibacter amylolyticus]
MSNEISLVTGGNGHLGNNLIRLLLSENKKVRTTIRNINNKEPFKSLDCEVVQADITNRASLKKAFEGVTNLYAVAANFSMWAKNPKTEIYDNNMQGTQNVFDIAKECGVKNIVYVSSVASLDFTKLPANVDNGYNKDRRNWYYNSKNDSDKLALELGNKYGIRTVLVLPSAMIGSKAYKLSYSNNLVLQVLNGEIPVDTNVTLNWVDVKDVAIGTYNAMVKGRNSERYILSNEKHTTLQETVKIASELYPELKLKTPKKVPKCLLYSVAGLMEFSSKITGKEPLLQRHYLDMFYGLKQDYDITKSREVLGFNPKPSKKALEDALIYLKTDWIKNK